MIPPSPDTTFTYEAGASRIVFGAGSGRALLDAELARLGLSRVLVICAASDRMLAAPCLDTVAGRVAAEFDEVLPHVPVEVARRAEGAAARCAADGLLCIGGGSTTGTAKAVALQNGLPIVAVPTTYAGSEMTPVWGLTSQHRKETGRSMVALPKTVVYDPELTVSLPPALTSASSLNALAHCVEALYAPGANPITSAIALDGIAALAQGAPQAVREPSDLTARARTLYGACSAGAAFAVAGSGLHHKICHVLGGAYDLPHAEMHAVLLPHVVGLLEPLVPEPLRRVAAALADFCGNGAAMRILSFAAALDAPMSLAALGLSESHLDEAVRLVLEQTPATMLGTIEPGEIRTTLDAAIRGLPVRRGAGAGPAAAAGEHR